MNNNTIELIVQTLEDRKQTIVPTNNSIFRSMDLADQNDKCVNELCGKLANIINAELILVKNKLIPFMQEIANQFQTAIDEAPSVSELTKYQIKTLSIPGLLDELSAQGLLAPKRAPLPIGRNGVLIPTPTEGIRDYFKYEKASIDLYVKQILKNYTDEDLTNIWDKYLSNIGPTNNNIPGIATRLSELYDVICLLYVALDNLRKVKPEGVSAPDDIYFQVTNVFFNEISNYISIALDNVSKFRSLDRVIDRIDDRTFTAYVDPVVYDKFIKELQKPDIILGMIATPTARETAKYLLGSIKKDAEEYLDTWSSKVKQDQQSSLGRAIEKYKLIYKLKLETIYNQYIPFDLKEHITQDLPTILNQYDELIKTIPFNEILDVNYIARLIVAKLLFPDTNFDFFSSCMLSYSKLNDNITPSDAATFASIDFILKFILSQVELVGNDQVANF